MKILVTSHIAQKGIEIFEKAGIGVDTVIGETRESLKAFLPLYDGIIVRSETRVDKDLIDHADRLSVIGRAGTGLDNIDIKTAKEKGIAVFSAAGANKVSVAEHTIAMMLALARHIPQATGATRRGRWERHRFMGIEICGKTLGVIGLGLVGKEVARRAKAFGMELCLYDPYIKHNDADEFSLDVITDPKLFDSVLGLSDIVTLHVPLNNETRGMISHHQFTVMKTGSRLINCARGAIVNQDALLEAIDSEIISGYAVDVFDDEPVADPGHPFYSRQNIICTPHIAGMTHEAIERASTEVCHKVVEYLKKRNLTS
jgi:D-3-phosphoglycerate dehydrogenase / 2-oxoglutarate reductase